MFIQFNYGDPNSVVRDRIGDFLAAEVEDIDNAEIVGRLTGWGSWVDAETGVRYTEQSGSLQFVVEVEERLEATVREVVELIARQAAEGFKQDEVAVLHG